MSYRFPHVLLCSQETCHPRYEPIEEVLFFPQRLITKFLYSIIFFSSKCILIFAYNTKELHIGSQPIEIQKCQQKSPIRASSIRVLHATLNFIESIVQIWIYKRKKVALIVELIQDAQSSSKTSNFCSNFHQALFRAFGLFFIRLVLKIFYFNIGTYNIYGNVSNIYNIGTTMHLIIYCSFLFFSSHYGTSTI